MKASACSKVILLGEHAVVYDVPAVAVPLSSVRAYVYVLHSDAFVITAANDTSWRLTEADQHPFVELLKQISRAVQMPLPPQRFHIDSQIPMASGLGSGAAIATALGRALLQALECSMSNEALNALVYESETYYHGTPSGIDNTVVVYERPVYFQRSHPVRILENFTPFTLVVADTGLKAPTREAVADVRRLYTEAPQRVGAIFDEIRQIVERGVDAMIRGDIQQLGAAFNANHSLLQALTVSCPALDTLVDAARSAGALGAKLSGGGRGGNMIALVNAHDARNVEECLIRAGAVWTAVVEVEP
jgi:mevalonate kinase